MRRPTIFVFGNYSGRCQKTRLVGTFLSIKLTKILMPCWVSAQVFCHGRLCPRSRADVTVTVEYGVQAVTDREFINT